MAGVFEVDRYDAAGRLGTLTVPRAGVTVATPVLLPVVNPHVQTVPPSRLAELGVEMLITNSYVLHGSDELREPALDQGLASLLGFDGAIMTDSGSYQLAEYGSIDVTTAEILAFQEAIGSHVGTPVDIPTAPAADREQATAEWETTQERLAAAATVDTGDMLVTAPVQGGVYPDLRERAGRAARETGLDVYPVGGVVPLLREYRFAEMVEVVLGAKRGLGEAAPVHLFGAGHPMMFALAAALGCDLFDSAAYALYARDGRYLTVRGTEHLSDLRTFPCECPVCTAHEPADLASMDEDDDERQHLLAEHNLHVSLGEMRRVRQAIRQGSLLELVETRARAHPALLDGYRTMLDHAAVLEATDPVSKASFFYLSAESARRPEVRRHHDRLGRLSIPEDSTVFLTTGGHTEAFDESWRLRPPFGPVPPALSDAYPLTAELPEVTDRAALAAAVRGVAALVEANPTVTVTLAHDGWPDDVLDGLPERVTVERVDRVGDEAATPSGGPPEDGR